MTIALYIWQSTAHGEKRMNDENVKNKQRKKRTEAVAIDPSSTVS